MLREKASLHEGHGFSRAIKGLPTTALAAEVRFSTHTGQRHLSPRLSSPQTMAKALITASYVARLNPCPSLINATRKNLLPFRQLPINRTNLILFGQPPFKAINKSHRQKANCSANLDRFEVQPSLRDALYPPKPFRPKLTPCATDEERAGPIPYRTTAPTEGS
jgi:hypothetical protein